MGWFEELELRLLDFNLTHGPEFVEAYNEAVEKFDAIVRKGDNLGDLERAVYLAEENREALESIVTGLWRTPNKTGKGMDHVEKCRAWTEDNDLWHLSWKMAG